MQFKTEFQVHLEAVFDKYMIDGQTSDRYLSEHPDPYEVYQVIQHIRGTTKRFVVILDEFDKISEMGTKVAVSETIKTLSDNDGNSTVILVGVARSIREIFEGHESLPRSMQQVPMPVMSEEELHSILNSRLNLLGMTMEEEVRKSVVTMSQGFPNYTHLLGMHICLKSARRESIDAGEYDLQLALKEAVSDVEETISDNYYQAVQSVNPKNQYREVLLACSLAKTDERNQFPAAALRAPLSQILGRPMDIPAYAKHLSEFCKPERGPALVKVGARKNYKYFFVDPLLRPFSIIKGLEDQMITTRHLT